MNMLTSSRALVLAPDGLQDRGPDLLANLSAEQRRGGEPSTSPAGRAGERSPTAGSAAEPRRKLPPLDALTVAKSGARQRADLEPSREPGPPAHLLVAAQRYAELDVALEPRTKTYWCYFNPAGRPSFTPGLLRDLSHMQRSIREICPADTAGRERPIEYFVVGSRTRGAFNFGGDLTLFAEKIRAGDREGLRVYAQACVDVVFNNAVSYDRPIVTVALVQGDALGGGFEAALSCDVIVAERGVKFGLPEVLFNLFPGMGAYSFLSRRLGAARARDLILGGHTHSAEALRDMGVVQVLAEPGRGREAVEAYIERSRRRHNAQSALFRASREVNPVSLDELRRIADLWVDAALQLRESDIRRMEKIVAAQVRRRAGPAAAAG